MKPDFRKILSVYIVIFFASVLLLIALASVTWQSKVEEYENEQYSYLRLLESVTGTLVQSQQSLLRTIGQQTLSDRRLSNRSASMLNLNKVQRENPNVAYFLLLDKKGSAKFSSSNLDSQSRASLYKENQYSALFNRAINTSDAVIGRTHSYAESSSIVPIAQSIFDQKSRLLGVVLVGIDLSFNNILTSGKLPLAQITIGILREDRHWQTLINSEPRLATYAKELTVEEMAYLTNADVGVNKSSLPILLFNRLVSGKLDPSHKVVFPSTDGKSWYVSEIKSESVLASFLVDLAPLILSLLLFNILAFVLVIFSHRKEARIQNHLIEQTMHDGLTNLPNSLYLRKEISNWMDFKKLKRSFSILYVDIDNFKSVNVSHGQEFGDRILKLVAERLEKLVQNNSLLIRQTGNGFVYVVESVDQFVLDNHSQDILYSLSIPFVIEKNTFLLGGSIGIARYPENGETLDELLSAAELALREAKKSFNTALFFNEQMEENNRYSMRVEQKLRQAIKQKSPYVVYQPQLDSNGRLYGVEVLVRWTDEDLGEVNPANFVSIAESSGLIISLGELILSKAFRELEMVQKRQKTKFQISLNVSIRQFMHEGFVEGLKKRIMMYNLDPSYITLEITENLFIEDIEKMRPIFDDLRAYSIKISLDDFGTGYSSLSMLTEIKLDELKIDKNFVDNIHIDPQSLTMVKNIIAIGKNYNMSVLAEGVETIDQKEMLKRCGCDAFQGYFYSKPIMFYELEDYLKTFGGSDNVVRMIGQS
jgi:diguanylate cyclase (GGDEF)-like protein